MKIYSLCGTEFSLTRTRIIQWEHSGRIYRYVLLADLRKFLRRGSTDTALPVEKWPHILFDRNNRTRALKRGPTWLEVEDLLSIGCKKFGEETTRLIYKAAKYRAG